jgi:dihydroxy-acid dehydratase
MAMVLTTLGLSPIGFNDIPATHPAKSRRREALRRTGDGMLRQQSHCRANADAHLAFAMRRAWSRRRPAPPMPCCTCWRSRAKPACEWTLEDFEPASAHTPVIADLKPGGRYTAVELFGAGGSARVAQELIAAGMLEDTPTVTGRSLFEEAGGRAARRNGQDVMHPVAQPFKPRGGYSILYGNLAPEGCILKLAGKGAHAFRRHARVFESEEHAFAAVQADASKATSS